MLNQPEAGAVKTVIRRRPSSRHRRNRFVRRVLLVVFGAGFALALASIALRQLSPSLFRAANSEEPSRESLETTRNLLLQAQQESLRQIENRPVYRYSVVPGGVRDAHELKRAAQHDPVVAAHYAGFDYAHARVVRLAFMRAAYVSYRIGNKIFWTRHRLKLRKGETVITDGKIIVRSRCANRIEELPQQAMSALEPPAVKFDEPMVPALGIASSTPAVPYQSAVNRGLPGFGPALPLNIYDPIGGGTFVPITPPELPGVCGIDKKPKNPPPTTKKKKGNPCGGGGGGGGGLGEIPEPGTWLLVASGLVALGWKFRHQFVRTSPA